MKKLLIASTAVALSAGAVATPTTVEAQGVTVTGDARMGLVYDNRLATGNTAEWQFTSRARVIFTLSGETDTGLSFGASFRADNAGSAAGNTQNTAAGVFISGAFGRLTVGDAAGAARARVGDLHFTSLTGIGDPNEMTYIDRIQQSDNDTADIFGFGDPLQRRTAVRYDYSIDGFTVSASLDQLRDFNNASLGGITVDRVRPQGFSLGGSYDFGMGRVNAGYEHLRLAVTGAPNATFGHFILGGDVTFEGITARGIIGFATNDLGDLLDALNFSKQQYGLSVQGTFDAITANAFYRRDFFETDRFGVGASLDLGGGASVVGSVAYRASNNQAGLTSQTRADLGVAMRF